MPTTFLTALFRRFAKLFPLTRLWQYGVFIKHGGCDVLLEYFMHQDKPGGYMYIVLCT